MAHFLCSAPSPSSIFLFILYYLLSHLRPSTSSLTNEITSLDMATKLHIDQDSMKSASLDYGNLVHEPPSAVFHPSSLDDIISLVKFTNNLSTPFTISPRGCGHSVRGQAMARDGVVMEMSALKKSGRGIRVSWNPTLGHYADVGGEEMWINVMNATMELGLSPVSWTDFLYLSVGGTLSNAGISGQSFLHGPQISNVHELDVITGKGEFITCSKEMNSELFYAVLGGLGQFGIITRARIVLKKAPTRAKWVRLLYSDFSKFTSDQEHLISIREDGPNYVEGSLITEQVTPNNWRASSFYSSFHQSKINSLLRNNQGLLYALEFVLHYDDQTANSIDQKLQEMVDELSFVPGFVFRRDVPIADFLNRVGGIRSHNNNNEKPKEKEEEEIRSHNNNNEKPEEKEEEEEAHPWLNLFIPKSGIMEFNAGVFEDKIRNHSHISGPLLFYPFHRQKWDDQMSVVIPDEDIFYTLALLPTCRPDEAEIFDKLNNEIIEFCEKSGIKIKQYLPDYNSKEDWMKHYGPKWNVFYQRKLQFDPKMILSPGQKIFTSLSLVDK